MDKLIHRSINLIALQSVLIFLFAFNGWAVTSDHPRVIRKKIHKQLVNPEKPQASDQSTYRPDEPALSPRSDISRANIIVEKKPGVVVKSITGNAKRPPYSPEGKIDPFERVLSQEPEINRGIFQPVIEPDAQKSPLINFDLSQLKVTGIILATSGNKGLVKEPAGRGHIVKMGSYIGSRGGKVIKIINDTLIVEEKLTDYSGKLFIRHKEMKLIKKGVKK